VAAVTASLSAFSLSVMALATAVIIVVAPVGLALKGRTSKLAWTRRLRTVAAVFAVLDVALLPAGGGHPTSAALASILFLQPVIVDLALLVTLPFSGWPPAGGSSARAATAGGAPSPSPSPARTARRRRSSTSATSSPGSARCWPARPASTTPAAWPAR
jgi:hypothetical protein